MLLTALALRCLGRKLLSACTSGARFNAVKYAPVAGFSVQQRFFSLNPTGERSRARPEREPRSNLGAKAFNESVPPAPVRVLIP